MREHGLLDMGDLAAPQGSLSWIKAVHVEAKAALKDARVAREHVECWVKALLEDNRYRQLRDADGKPFLLWSVFCKADQPFGLGYDPEAIDAIIAERPAIAGKASERAAKAAEVTTPDITPNGQGERVDIGNLPKLSQGDRAQQNGIGERTQRKLDCLARDFPEIHKRVVSGELSTHAAYILAGKESPRANIPADDPVKAAQSLARKFKEDSLRRLVRALESIIENMD
jgi:hypothetical protein